jgi:hypothetical protein
MYVHTGYPELGLTPLRLLYTCDISFFEVSSSLFLDYDIKVSCESAVMILNNHSRVPRDISA